MIFKAVAVTLIGAMLASCATVAGQPATDTFVTQTLEQNTTTAPAPLVGSKPVASPVGDTGAKS